jgi:hypothetical protein
MAIKRPVKGGPGPVVPESWHMKEFLNIFCFYLPTIIPKSQYNYVQNLQPELKYAVIN